MTHAMDISAAFGLGVRDGCLNDKTTMDDKMKRPESFKCSPESNSKALQMVLLHGRSTSGGLTENSCQVNVRYVVDED